MRTIEITLEEVAAINRVFDVVIDRTSKHGDSKLSCALSILDTVIGRGIPLLADDQWLDDVELPDRWDKES